jgi:uncharacterized protein
LEQTIKKGYQDIYIDIVVEDSIADSQNIMFHLMSHSYKSENSLKECFVEIMNQNDDVDWEKEKLKTPYSLEAITSENELIGRDELINKLYSKIISHQTESTILFGQKRVGKTSVAKTLINKLNKLKNVNSIYLETGQFNKNSPNIFVTELGEEIKYQLEELFDIELDSVFDGSLSPLLRLFRKIHKVYSDHKIIVVIDEFDEIPHELKYYTEIGDTFFHNIRSITGEDYIGFILVGGENMQSIMQNTDRLNKFTAECIDYFDKEESYKDFTDLIQKPVEKIIEFENEAIEYLYKCTDGNPFFTKIICSKLYINICNDKRSYITFEDIKTAYIATLSSLQMQNINHFWKDCINVKDIIEKDIVETERRKFLIQYRELKERNKKLSLDNLSADTTTKHSILESFKNRRILVDSENGMILRPMIFENWLFDFGYYTLSQTFTDENIIKEHIADDLKKYITATEIVEIEKKFGLYKGHKISSDDIRIWLDQFSNNDEKRIMYKLLQNIVFYSESLIREKLSIIHDKVKVGVIHKIKDNERTRKDIIISSFGSPVKSSSSYARLYASENKIISKNSIPFEKLKSISNSFEDISAIVFVDDIFASGDTIIEFLDAIHDSLRNGIKVYITAITGYSKAIDKINEKALDIGLDCEILVADILDERDSCFSINSNVFPDDNERTKAYEICNEYGKKIAKKIPLGYDNLQSLIVFPDNCPNNSLPILWKKLSKPVFSWQPLFERN